MKMGKEHIVKLRPDASRWNGFQASAVSIGVSREEKQPLLLLTGLIGDVVTADFAYFGPAQSLPEKSFRTGYAHNTDECELIQPL